MPVVKVSFEGAPPAQLQPTVVVVVLVVVLVLVVATVVVVVAAVVVVVGGVVVVVAAVVVVVATVVVVVVGGHMLPVLVPHRASIILPQLPHTLGPPPQSHVCVLQAVITFLKHWDLAEPLRPERLTSSLQARRPHGAAAATGPVSITAAAATKVTRPCLITARAMRTPLLVANDEQAARHSWLADSPLAHHAVSVAPGAAAANPFWGFGLQKYREESEKKRGGSQSHSRGDAWEPALASGLPGFATITAGPASVQAGRPYPARAGQRSCPRSG